MKKNIYFLLILLIIFINPIYSFEIDDSVITLTKLNLRENPSTDSPKIQLLNENTLLKIISKSDIPELIIGHYSIWYNVITETGVKGWLYGAFVDRPDHFSSTEKDILIQDFFLYSKKWNKPFFFGDQYNYHPVKSAIQQMSYDDFYNELKYGNHYDITHTVEKYLKSGIKAFVTEDLIFSSKKDSNEIYYISFTDKDIETRRGISIGSSYEEVLLKYGNSPYSPEVIPNPNLSASDLYDGLGGFFMVYGLAAEPMIGSMHRYISIGFVFSEAKVSKIIIFTGWPYGI